MKIQDYRDNDEDAENEAQGANRKEREHYCNGGGGYEIEAEPWWRDPATIPRRQFLYGRHLIRRNISATVGAGGRAKTTQILFEAVEMAVGRNLTTDEPLPHDPLRVVYLNAEEDQDELDRRLAAICQRYNVSEADLDGRLFVMSVRDRPLRLATLVQGAPTLNQPALDALTVLIKRCGADVFILDPWVSFHSVNESGNSDMDLLIKEGLGGIASKTNSAGEILHHPGKPRAGTSETTVEDARGASAIIWAVRSARVFNFMSTDEATKLGIPEEQRRRHVRISNGKSNVGPVGKAVWIKIEAEPLPNGDEVACASRWSPPNPFDGISATDAERAQQLVQAKAYRADPRSPEWFGYALADLLNIPVRYGGDNDPKDLTRIKVIIKTWIKNKVLRVEHSKDDHRKGREFIVAGAGATATVATDDDPLGGDEITLQ
jgi:hypothetical protein